MKNKSISIVLPAFNEEENIEFVVKESLDVLPKITKDYEILIVDDGSTDRTGEIINKLAKIYSKIKVIHHPKNTGFAGVRKTAYSAASKELIFFAPSDRQVKISEIDKFVEKIKECDVVVSYRIKRPENFRRVITSWVFHTILRYVFSLPIKEMSACVMHKRDLVKTINIESTSAFVEAEILYKLHKNGAKIGEVPISYFPRIAGKSKGDKISVIILTCWDLFKLGIKLRFRK